MLTVLIVLSIVAAAVGGYAYIVLVVQKTNVASAAVAKPQSLAVVSGWQWIVTKLDGWKTHVLAWISAAFGGLALIPADVANAWTGLPWAAVFDQKVAAYIAIVCGMLIPITHSFGLAKAALTPPADPQA